MKAPSERAPRGKYAGGVLEPDSVRSEKMDDRWNQDDQNKHYGNRVSLPGVIALGVVTAAVIGSVLFSFGEKESITIPSVSQLLEAGQEGNENLPEENSGSVPDQSWKTEAVSPGRIKGPLDVSDVVEVTMPSIVAITSESVQVVESFFYGTYEIPSESAGSGIIIGENEEELLIATNYHVVEGSDSITVCFSVEEELTNDAIAEAKIKGTDSSRDLAVVAVKIEEIPEKVRNSIKIAKIGDSDSLVVGERAIAIGNALGYGQSVTAGIISAVNRKLNIDQTPQIFIQTDAAINFGNSGGALLNIEGQVIGINSAKAASNGVERMGYAIPINDAKPILEKLMSRMTRDKVEDSEKGSLGAELRNVSEEAQQLYSISAGAFVYELFSDSALAAAGLSKGDIITEFDDNRVSSAEELEGLLDYYKAGETVTVVYETAVGGAYQEKTAEVTLREAPEPETEIRYQEQPYYDPFSRWGNSWWGY